MLLCLSHYECYAICWSLLFSFFACWSFLEFWIYQGINSQFQLYLSVSTKSCVIVTKLDAETEIWLVSAETNFDCETEILFLEINTFWSALPVTIRLQFFFSFFLFFYWDLFSYIYDCIKQMWISVFCLYISLSWSIYFQVQSVYLSWLQGFTYPVRAHFLEDILEMTGYKLSSFNQIDDYGQEKLWKTQRQLLPRKRKNQITALVEVPI